MSSLIVFLLSLVLVAALAVQATKHTVGGDSGWNPTADLSSWTSGKTFTVGDTLEFNYGPVHGVAVVTENDYNNCNTANPISSYSGGKTTISLDKAGPKYFICPTPGHCQGGMKLFISVIDGAGGGIIPGTGKPPPSIPVVPVRGPDPVIGSPPSPRPGGFPPPAGGFPSPDPVIGGPPPPSRGGFPSPAGGFPSPVGGFQPPGYGPPSPDGCFTNPFGTFCGPYGGSGQTPYQGAASGKLTGGSVLRISLVMAVIVALIVS